jgi:N-acetylmuramic acid 6-phosphate etherase
MHNQFWAEYKRFLHANLITEAPNPLSYNLSELCKNDLVQAFAIFQTIELNAINAMLSYVPLIEKLRHAINKCLAEKNKIYLIGCGASGRLAMLIKRIYEFEHPDLPKQIVCVSSAGDTSLIKAVEKFEDNREFGIKQLLQQSFTNHDLVIGLSASGESPFILAALEYANQNSKYKPWLIFNNPIDSLLKRNPTHIVQNINSMALDVGPMALTGSTRLQATTAMQIALGLALSDKDITEQIKEIYSTVKKIPLANLAQITVSEADIITNQQFILYTTSNPLMGLTMLADITERSPTFNLPPFENTTDSNINTYSPFYLSLTSADNPSEVWQMLLGQPPTCLEWTSFPATKIDYMNGFDLSRNSLRSHGKYLPYQQYTTSWEVSKDNIIIKLNDIAIEFDLPDNILQRTIIYKLLLNSHSTLMMGRLGYFTGNMMLSLKPSNFKLIDRAIRYSQFILNDKYNLSYHEVAEIVFAEIEKLQPNQSIVKQVVDRVYETHK